MEQEKPIIVWLRHDLRLADNPALYHAAYNKTPILPVFIYDPDAMDRDYGAAQKWWLHHALISLRDDFKKNDVDFIVRKGDSKTILDELIKEIDAGGVYWNRFYEKWQIDRDTDIKKDLHNRGLDVHSFQAHVLFEPWKIESGSGHHYKVFTPYYKNCMEKADKIDDPLPEPNSMVSASHSLNIGNINDFAFLPEIRWDKKMQDDWEITENAAHKQLSHFLKNGLENYETGRDCPSIDATSRMSPYLRWGMISPRTIWYETKSYIGSHNVSNKQGESYLRELFWREFTHHLLYYYPDMKSKPIQEKFEDFPWKRYKTYREAWQKGETGYPLVDAGMRQLWQTGWMHNRVRMIVGSLFVKHLLQPWQDGEAWFWDCLVDADPANNTAGWQWIGGCGADAAPYFRIFNPITQGEKFDSYDYVRKFVPEIADLPDKYLFSPWEAGKDILQEYGIKLGETYPEPLVTHKEGRERALDAFKKIKK
tara:strand:+ start:506 stop:1945 length:1440 start_codon:yes stop_codon:yes gene_type:complete